MNWLALIGISITIGIAFAIETSREFILDKLSEGIDSIKESFDGLFTNIREFSTAGLIAGAVMDIGLYAVRGNLIDPFIKAMPAAQGFITMIAAYAVAFGVGYLMMKRAFEQGG